MVKMVEYLYNAIRATAGDEITIVAKISNNDGTPINDNCTLVIYADCNTPIVVNGVYKEGIWSFTISASVTKDLKGRYYYCFYKRDEAIAFK